MKGKQVCLIFLYTYYYIYIFLIPIYSLIIYSIITFNTLLYYQLQLPTLFYQIFKWINFIQLNMKQKNSIPQKYTQLIIQQKNKLPGLKIQLPPKNTQIDDRWMELKIIGKNLQPRSYHAAAIYKNIFYVHGGYDVQKGILSDFYKLEMTTSKQGFQWVTLPQNVKNFPGKLKCHTCVTYQNKLFIFGGQKSSEQNNNNVYIFDTDKQAWLQITPNIQIPKLDSHFSIISQGKMYVYGGYNLQKAKFSVNFYQFDLVDLKWNLYYKPDKDAIYPEPRSSFAMVLYKGQCWMFGGANSMNTLNDMWKFNLKNRVWSKIIVKENVPEPRRNSSMICYQNLFFLFGGIQDVTKQKNDIFIYNPELNQWYKIHSSTNSIYEISPTLKQKRDSLKKKQQRSPGKKNDKKIPLFQQTIETNTRRDQNTDKTQIMKRILQQNKQKKFLQKKNQMLKEFSDKPQDKQRKLSPISQNMLKTLQVIGQQEQTTKLSHHEVLYDLSGKFILGKKPCARDAHTANLYEQKILIFGGDRHLMSFSDLYFFDLKKGIESKNVYFKQK